MVVATAAPMVIVASALMIEYAGGAITWQPLILIGDASYAIYLTHMVVFDTIGLGNDRWLHVPAPKESTAVMLFYAAVATVVGITLHLYVENPMLCAMRRKMDDRARTTVSKHSGQAATGQPA